jgi:hypothetical protein
MMNQYSVHGLHLLIRTLHHVDVPTKCRRHFGGVPRTIRSATPLSHFMVGPEALHPCITTGLLRANTYLSTRFYEDVRRFRALRRPLEATQNDVSALEPICLLSPQYFYLL